MIYIAVRDFPFAPCHSVLKRGAVWPTNPEKSQWLVHIPGSEEFKHGAQRVFLTYDGRFMFSDGEHFILVKMIPAKRDPTGRDVPDVVEGTRLSLAEAYALWAELRSRNQAAVTNANAGVQALNEYGEKLAKQQQRLDAEARAELDKIAAGKWDRMVQEAREILNRKK